MIAELFIMLARENGSQLTALVESLTQYHKTSVYSSSMLRFEPLLVLGAWLALMIQSSTIAFAEDSREKQIEPMLARIGSANEPGVAVLVRKDGKTLIQVGHGVRDLRSSAQVNAQTDFRLASCTKQFTAMAVILLIHDGKLRYDTRLTDVFPEFPSYGKAITIRQLLNHTSGLPDYEELMDKASAGKSPIWTEMRQITDAEVLKLLKAEKNGKFRPGTRWSYSNSGYVVLGLVVAKVSGESFPEFLRDRIFKPLGMDHSLAYAKGTNEVPNRAYGHSVERSGIVETDQSSTSATLGDGTIYSNLEDLAKWDEALSRHTLLSEAEMQAGLTAFRLPDGSLPHWDSYPEDVDPLAGKPVSYGFGWFLDPYKGHPRMWHYGETVGFRSSIQRFPKDQLTVIVLSNRSDANAIELATQIADLFLK
jgi:CubicO group peptidase (beta-lactamase class C family)